MRKTMFITTFRVSNTEISFDEHAAQQRRDGHVQRDAVRRGADVAEELHGGQY